MSTRYKQVSTSETTFGIKGVIPASVRSPPVLCAQHRGDRSGHGSLPCSVQRSHTQHTRRTGYEVGIQGQRTGSFWKGMAGLLGIAGKNSDEAGWAEEMPAHTRPQSRATCNGCAVFETCTDAEESPPGGQGPPDGSSCPGWPAENRRVAILTCPYHNGYEPLCLVLSCEVTLKPDKECGILARREEARDVPQSPGPQGRRSTCLPSSPTRNSCTPHPSLSPACEGRRRTVTGANRTGRDGDSPCVHSGPLPHWTVAPRKELPVFCTNAVHPKHGTTAMTIAASQNPVTTLRH